MNFNLSRVEKLEAVEHEVRSKKNILYKMSREHRVENNWSLIYAQKLAIENDVKLFVIYTHYDKKWECVSRTVSFLLENLEQVQKDLFEKNISLEYVENNTKNKTSDFLKKYCNENDIGLIVTDMAPQIEYNAWQENFLENNKQVAVHIVEARNITPVWVTSEKEEFAARTVRSKIYKKISGYVDGVENKFSKIKIHTRNDNKYIKNILNNTNWQGIRENFKCVESELTFEGLDFVGSELEAKKRLELFIKNKLESYDADRNVATLRGQSDLSPYINFGIISKQYILEYILEKYNLQINDVLDPEKNGSGSAVNINNTKLTDNLIKSIRAFVEELIIRGELADNYVYYNKNHNNFEGLANWAKLALEKGKNDTREYIYTQKEFENASTHDTLWNAAQNQMMRSGKMHGYMRMYWAKKILEWTSSPEEAIEIALYLNDKYSIDGWSPGGYIGVLWSIGGLHDRAWFARPVFSTIRYMAVSGCEKKFNIKEYKEKWNTKILLEENKLF